MRFSQTDVRILNGELENHFSIFYAENANEFDECNLNKHDMVLGNEIR
jgi:hypothetical protein